MAATVSIRYDFGGGDAAPGTNQDIDLLGPPNLKWKLADNATIDTANPIVKPGAGAGPYYSYWKHIYLYVDNADGKTISNVRVYSDGTNNFGTGLDLRVGLQFPTKNSGSDAGYEVADTDATMVANHTGITSAASIFDYTSGSPLTVSISEAGNVMNANGETCNYVVYQFSVANTASAGLSSSEYTYWDYDEA